MRFLLSFAFLSAVVQSLPVEVKHYDLLHNTSTDAPNYIDADTQSYYAADSGELGTDKYDKYNQFEHQPYVANGFIGARIPNLGFGFTYDQNANLSSSALENGWPLLDRRFSGAFIAGFYDLEDKHFPQTNFPELYANGYDGAIAAIPQWTDFRLTTSVNGSKFVLDPRLTNESVSVGGVTSYNQALNIKNGIVTTSYRWLDMIDVKVTVLAHRSIESLGLVHFEIESDQDVEIKFEKFIDFATAQRCDYVEADELEDSVYMIFKPHLIEATNGTIISRLHSDSIDFGDGLNTTVGEEYVSQTFTTTFTGGQIYNLTNYIGVGSTDHNSTDYFTEAQEAADTDLSFEELVIIHQQTWYDLIGSNHFSVPSSELITLAAEASLYHLLANQRASSVGVESALGVSGLSSDSYAGLQFWDTDLWMIPAVAPFSPGIAKAVSKYRVYTHEQAKLNAQSHGMDGAVYPWTSGRYGNCTSTGPCFDYEYHINVDIVYSLWKLFLAGAVDDDYMIDTGYALFEDAAAFFADYVTYNDTLKKYTTLNLTDPDEYANQVNNGAYTNVGIAQVMKWATLLGNHLGLGANDSWMDIAENMYLPRSEFNITMEYDTMNSSIEVKQADVIMIDLFDDEDGSLEQFFDYTDTDKLDDLYYYSEHQAPQGPAMTFPVFSIVSAKLSEAGCSSTSYLMKSIKPFLRYPFVQMSEQNYDDFDLNGGTHPAFPFLTGHGGVLQSIVYGLTGLKFSYEVDNSTGEIEPLLIFDPVKLPCLPGGISVDNFHFQDVALYVELNDTDSVVYHHGNVNKTITLKIDDRNPDSGIYKLEPYQSLHFALYETAKNIEGSITECAATVIDSSESIHGDVVETVLDGDNSTTWQSTDFESAYLLIDLGQEHDNVTQGLIVWGDNPAQQFSLYGSTELSTVKDAINGTDATSTLLVGNFSVDISSAYDAKTSANIDYSSSRNYTSFDLESDDSFRYVLLELVGSYDSSEGASIAEFNLMQ